MVKLEYWRKGLLGLGLLDTFTYAVTCDPLTSNSTFDQ
jgi:hypothetical protein